VDAAARRLAWPAIPNATSSGTASCDCHTTTANAATTATPITALRSPPVIVGIGSTRSGGAANASTTPRTGVA
jgi:hypothetical protein